MANSSSPASFSTSEQPLNISVMTLALSDSGKVVYIPVSTGARLQVASQSQLHALSSDSPVGEQANAGTINLTLHAQT